MQFETIVLSVFILALLVFMFTRRRIITDLQQQNHELAHQVEKLRLIAVRQRDEMDRLIRTAEQERRARQMATLAAVANQTPAPRPPITKPKEWKDPDLSRDPYKNTMAKKREEATRPDAGNTWAVPVNSWDDHNFSAAPAPAPAYHGGGGSFDGGGASGDYGRSDSCSSSSSSSSSDSGSSSSSDSGSSCGSSD